MTFPQKMVVLSHMTIAKQFFSVLCAGILLTGSGCVYVTSSVPVEDNPAITTSISGNITIESPTPRESIFNPLHIVGQARVFENNVSWRVKNWREEVVASGFAISNAPDMGQFGAYEVFVPIDNSWQPGTYRVEVLSYSAKDGSEQDLVSIPVTLSPQENQIVSLAFLKNGDSSYYDCAYTFNVTREIPKTISPARVVSTLLLEGPSSEEQAEGYTSAIPAGTTLRDISLSKEGLLTIDLGGEIENGLGGSCLVSSIRAQIENTLKQFETVKDVKILIGGQENRLEP